MYTLKVFHPHKTKAGKVAQSSKFEVQFFRGEGGRTMSLPTFCKEQGIILAGLLRIVRHWDEGDHHDAFVDLVAKMKSRIRGSYARHGKHQCCPSCGHLFHKSESAAARKKFHPQNFGESQGLDEPSTPEAPSSL